MAQTETKETVAVQARMHEMRADQVASLTITNHHYTSLTITNRSSPSPLCTCTFALTLLELVRLPSPPLDLSVYLLRYLAQRKNAKLKDLLGGLNLGGMGLNVMSPGQMMGGMGGGMGGLGGMMGGGGNFNDAPMGEEQMRQMARATATQV